MKRLPPELLRQASAYYAPAGLYARHFAAGKLGGDPVFVHLLRAGLLRGDAPLRVLDLGCGQALLGALCRAAADLKSAGRWPEDWPAPPNIAAYRGIELVARDVGRGAVALPEDWMVEVGDLCSAALGESDCVVVLDVLHYLPPAAQPALIRRIAEALAPGGRLITRLGDAGGRRMALATLIDRVVWLGRSHRRPTLHHRPMSEWRTLVEASGLKIESCAPVPGERFGNQLLVARRE